MVRGRPSVTLIISGGKSVYSLDIKVLNNYSLALVYIGLFLAYIYCGEMSKIEDKLIAHRSKKF